MESFKDFLATIENPEHRAKLEGVLNWIKEKFPGLETRIGWNQPMFTDHGTFIISFSVARTHFAVAPEQVAIERFEAEIRQSDYASTKMLFRIKWNQPVDYALLERIISFNIQDKAECKTFWRKPEKHE